MHLRQRQHGGHEFLDQAGIGLANCADQAFHLGAREQQRRMLAQHFAQMREEHGGRVDQGVAGLSRLAALRLQQPERRQAIARVPGFNAAQRMRLGACPERQDAVGHQFSLCNPVAIKLDVVHAGRQLAFVAYAHLGQHEAGLQRVVLAECADTFHQTGVAVAEQRHKILPDPHLDRVD